MFDSVLDEFLAFVLGFIKSDNMGNSEVFEDLEVVFREVAPLFPFVVHGSHEGDELAWNNPIEVAVLDLFVVLVLLGVEGLELVPAQLNGDLQTLEAVVDLTIIN